MKWNLVTLLHWKWASTQILSAQGRSCADGQYKTRPVYYTEQPIRCNLVMNLLQYPLNLANSFNLKKRVMMKFTPFPPARDCAHVGTGIISIRIVYMLNKGDEYNKEIWQDVATAMGV